MLRNVLNELQFGLREKVLGKIVLRKSLPRLAQGYSVEQERNFYRLVLTRGLAPLNQNHLFSYVTDVGCRNWSYAHALADFFPQAQITGVDVDGFRRYWNLYRRIDHAQAYAGDLRRRGREVQAYAKDFRDFYLPPSPSQVLFTFFFPFVSENPCLKWGLPARFVNFPLLLKHSLILQWISLAQGATWLSAHQGEWEASEARKAYTRAGLDWREIVLSLEETREFWPSPYETHILISQGPAAVAG